MFAIWGLAGAHWGYVRALRARCASQASPDRARILAAMPVGSVAVIAAGLFTAMPDPVAATPLAIVAIVALVLAILIGIRPGPLLPGWARSIEDATDHRSLAASRPAEIERAQARDMLVFTLGCC